MAEILLNIEVQENETLDADLKKELSKIEADVVKAMMNVGRIMFDGLKERINQDVYKAYTPKAYPRRSDNPAFGIPLNDVNANSQAIFDIQDGMIGGRVGLVYKPDGNNSATTADLDPTSRYYDATNPRPIKPVSKAVHGDALIRRIETGDGYDWKVKIGKREFWKNFVEEMVDNGAMEREIFWTLSSKGYEITLDEGVVREANDGAY